MVTLKSGRVVTDDGSFDRMCDEIRASARNEAEILDMLTVNVVQELVEFHKRKRQRQQHHQQEASSCSNGVGNVVDISGWVVVKKRSNRRKISRLCQWGCSASTTFDGDDLNHEIPKEAEEKEPDKLIKKTKNGRKRCLAVCDHHQEESAYTKPKRRRTNPKVVNFETVGLWPPPRIPTVQLKNVIEQMGGTHTNLVLMKQLFSTDLNTHHARFSIPVTQVYTEFLNEEEKGILEKHNDNGINITVVDPWLDETRMCLKKWRMNTSSSYVLTGGWNSLLDKNSDKKEEERKKRNVEEDSGVVLEEKDIVQIWSFRVNGGLCLALVKVAIPYADQNQAGRFSIVNDYGANDSTSHSRSSSTITEQ